MNIRFNEAQRSMHSDGGIENNEKFKKHFYLIYRDNDAYEQTIPQVKQNLENFGHKVDLQVFPVGTEQDEIDEWVKKNSEKMNGSVIYSDETCATPIYDNEDLFDPETVDNWKTGNLTYGIEYEYKTKAAEQVFANSLENPTSKLEQFGLLCNTIFQNNSETIPKKVYYNLNELSSTILNSPDALAVVQAHLNEKEKNIIQEAYASIERSGILRGDTFLANIPSMCLIVRTLHRILEKSASDTLGKKDTKIDYGIVYSYGLSDSKIKEYEALGLLDSASEIVGEIDNGRMKLDPDINKTENWFVGHHHPVNNTLTDYKYNDIKRIVLDDIINTASMSFPQETTSFSVLPEDQKNKIIEELTEKVFKLKKEE